MEPLYSNGWAEGMRSFITVSTQRMWIDLDFNCLLISYWTKSRTIIGQINGTVHNNYLEITKTYNNTFHFYNLFNVMSKWGDEGKMLLVILNKCCLIFVIEWLYLRRFPLDCIWQSLQYEHFHYYWPMIRIRSQILSYTSNEEWCEFLCFTRSRENSIWRSQTRD
jgi:hypothetical protein